MTTVYACHLDGEAQEQREGKADTVPLRIGGNERLVEHLCVSTALDARRNSVVGGCRRGLTRK